MIKDVSIPQMLERLQRLERAIVSFGIPIEADSTSPTLVHIIRADGEEVWRGSDLDTHYEAIQRQYPHAQLSIGWETSPVALI